MEMHYFIDHLKIFKYIKLTGQYFFFTLSKTSKQLRWLDWSIGSIVDYVSAISLNEFEFFWVAIE